MRNLVKSMCVAVLVALTGTSYAQTIGIKAGVNFSNMLAADDDENFDEDFKLKHGFLLGGTVAFPITEMFSLETGLSLSTKGYRIKESEIYLGEDLKTNNRMELYYLDIPVNVRLAFGAGKVKIYGIFGPYLGVGLAGYLKTKTTFMDDTEEDRTTVDWGTGEEDDFKRLDFGLTIGGGVEIKSFEIGLSYALGLANIASDTGNGTRVKNRVIGLAVGYRFGGEKTTK